MSTASSVGGRSSTTGITYSFSGMADTVLARRVALLPPKIDAVVVADADYSV
jgi:hypothetical protein